MALLSSSFSVAQRIERWLVFSTEVMSPDPVGLTDHRESEVPFIDETTCL